MKSPNCDVIPKMAFFFVKKSPIDPKKANNGQKTPKDGKRAKIDREEEVRERRVRDNGYG